MTYLWSIKHARRVCTASGVCQLGKGGSTVQVTRATESLRELQGLPQSWVHCPRKTCYTWLGWARAPHSHSGGLARSFSWKGSRRRHSPRSCSSIAGSSTTLTGDSSRLGFLLGCHLCQHRTPAATSIARPDTIAAPTRMSACWRKKLIPARECCDLILLAPAAPTVLTKSPTSWLEHLG